MLLKGFVETRKRGQIKQYWKLSDGFSSYKDCNRMALSLPQLNYGDSTNFSTGF